MKPEGDRATVTLRDSTGHIVEILEASDSMLYVTEGRAIEALMLSDVQSVHIHGYRISKKQRLLAVIPLLLLEGIAANALFERTDDRDEEIAVGILTSLSMGFTALSFAVASGNPDDSFSPPFDKARLQKLRLYSRYPQGLTDDQWARLLASNGQSNFVTLRSR